MLPQPTVLEFRDGERSVPEHVAHLIVLAELDTIRYTYEEAIEIANDALLRSRLNEAQRQLTLAHFRDHR